MANEYILNLSTTDLQSWIAFSHILFQWNEEAQKNESFDTSEGMSLWIDMGTSDWFFYNNKGQAFVVAEHEATVYDLDTYLRNEGIEVMK